MKKHLPRLLLAGAGLLAGLGAAGSASAGPTIPLGFRVGYTSDTFDQFHFGGHARLFELAPNFVIQPSLELGLGDNVTFWAGNVDIFYEFSELATPSWSFYAGGGVVLSHASFDGGGNKSNFGLDLAGGVTYALLPATKLFTEVRFGLEDAPDFKISVGLTFF